MQTKKLMICLVNESGLFRKFIFILLLGYCFNQGFAQTINKTTLNSTDDIESWIFNNYHPDSIKMAQICQSSIVFMRFKILKGGNIGNIAFNTDVPEFIMEALIKAVKSMRSNAIVAESLQSDEKIYLLPLVYYYVAACQTTIDPKRFTITEKDLKGNVVDNQLLGEAILNMLNFTVKGKTMALDCTILSPMMTSNGVMY